MLAVTAPAASALPASFTERVVLTGLTQPTSVAFAADGRVFVSEKSGLIQVFDSLSDPTPTRFADLRTNVHNFWDRGLSALTLDPLFPTRPYVYVTYTYDAPIGGTAPRWGTAGATTDGCPTPPGANTDGCVVSGRVSRLEISPANTMVGAELVLVNAWCQQFPSHTNDDVLFGRDGALYASAGDGASFNTLDWGQLGGGAGSPTPANPCGDPAPRWTASAWPGAPDGGGRLAARAGPAHLGRSGGPQRQPDPHRPEHGRRPAEQPPGRLRRRQRAPHRGPRLPQSLPPGAAAGHRRDLGGRRRRHALGGDQPRRRSHGRGPEPRLAVLRGRAAPAQLGLQ